MSELAIAVENLGKRYRIVAARPRYRTLRDSLVDLVRAPARLLGGRRPPSAPEVWALRDVSFEIRRGEAVGLIGRNGAGKTTLLKVLSRITEPTTGRAEIHGRVGSLLEVGTGFHPELTGRENVFLSGAILGMRRQEILSRFDEIVAFAEVEKFIDTPVKHYSSGMYLRLAFAVAAHLEPEILLVDEVLAVGDLSFQRRCLGKMGEIAGEGRTVVFVSHNMAAIASLTKRCLWLDGGLEQDGDTLEIVRRYVARSGEATRRVSWQPPRPGDEQLELLDCEVVSSESETNAFRVDEPVNVRIRCLVKRDAPGLRIGFDLTNAEGVLVLRSYHDDGAADPVTLEPGEYAVTCTIPGNLLNEGQYYLSLRASVHAVRRIVILDRVLGFTITNVSSANARYGARPGILNPSLTWAVAGS